METVSGQDSWNFFAKDFSTHIPSPGGGIGVRKFARQTRYITEVGLSDFARYDKAGNEATSLKMPYKLRLNPTLAFPDTYEGDVNAQLETIPAGSVLWKVYAYNEPEALGGTEEHIANIVTSSKMTRSAFGDHYLQFRH